MLSGGRLLPAFGLGAPQLAEWPAFGVARNERAAWFDESLPLMRRLWTEDTVDHHGARFKFEGVSVLPKPTQQPLDVWLGGSAPSELRRVGRMADGWLPSFTTPSEVAKGIDTIKQVAAEAGREIEEEHYGVLVGYRHGELSQQYVSASRTRRPDLDPNDVIPDGVASLRDRLEQFIAVGASKFVAIPVREPEDWPAELQHVADEVVRPLQS